MRKIYVLLALVASLFAVPAYADFTGKNAGLTTITFKNPGDCTSVVCVPIFSLFDPTGTNGAAVNTAGADAASNTANGLLSYSRNIVWNGTTWDRWMGDLTNGAWVNVKASVLPTGAATAAGVATVNTTLGTPMQNSGGSVTANLGTIAGVSTAANQATEISSLATIATNSGLPLPTQSTHTVNIGAVDSINQYPATAVPYTASATGTTAATTATLTGAASVTTYLCSLSIRSNATAAATGNATVTGTITGTLNYTHWTAPLASGIGITEMIFTPCVPASAANTSIAVVSPAPGTGGIVSVTATGYKL